LTCGGDQKESYTDSFTIGKDVMSFIVDEEVSVRYWKEKSKGLEKHILQTYPYKIIYIDGSQQSIVI
jgi:hypothetical protein